MALQQIQFLDENFMAEDGTRVGGGSRPRVSAMLGGSGSSLSALEFEFGAANVSNLNGQGGAYGIAHIQFSSARAPENVFIFVAREHGVSTDFGDFYFVPTSSSSQTNFQGVAAYQMHEIGSQVIGGMDPPDVRMYYFHLPDGTSSRTWALVRAGGGTQDDFSLWDSFIGNPIQVKSTISSGLSYQLIDPSLIGYSDSGRQYSVRKPKFYQISGLNLPYIGRNQRSALMRFYEQKGVTEPFWVAIDPDNHWDGPAFGPSFGAYRFESPPAFSHDFLDKFSVSMSLREAL